MICIKRYRRQQVLNSTSRRRLSAMSQEAPNEAPRALWRTHHDRHLLRPDAPAGHFAPELPQVLQPHRRFARAWAMPARSRSRKAMETKPRTPVVWLHGLECTCCSESFIRSAHPLAKDVVLSMISLDYDDTLMAAAGHQAEQQLEETITKYKGNYILAVRRQSAARRRRRVLHPRRQAVRREAAAGRERLRRRSCRGARARRGAACRRRSRTRRRPRRSTRSSPTSRSSRCPAARRSPR